MTRRGGGEFPWGTELEVKKILEAQGWQVFLHGFPDLMCFKNGEMKFVEVKQINGYKTDAQRKLFPVLQKHGLKVEIAQVSVDNEGVMIAYVNGVMTPEYRKAVDEGRARFSESVVESTTPSNNNS